MFRPKRERGDLSWPLKLNRASEGTLTMVKRHYLITFVVQRLQMVKQAVLLSTLVLIQLKLITVKLPF